MSLMTEWAIGSGPEVSLTYIYFSLLPLLLLTLRYVLGRQTVSTRSPKLWKAYDWPVIGSAIQFCTKRCDMLAEGSRAAPTGNFGFFVGKKHIVSVSGPVGRKAFYEARELNFIMGWTELLVGTPSVSEPGKQEERSRFFNKVFVNVARREKLESVLATWSSDILGAFEDLATEPERNGWRVMDPFDALYETVYKLTVRVVGPSEIADDIRLLRSTLRLIEQLERISSIANVIYGWLITPAQLKRAFYGVRLYRQLSAAVSRRQKSDRRVDDALQQLLDQGTPPDQIVMFLMSAALAGLFVTGTVAAWLPVLLAGHPVWMEKCRQEVIDVVEKNRTDPGQSCQSILSGLGIDEWEKEFPVVNCCIREAIRIIGTGAIFRKNTSKLDIPIGDTGEVIPAGSFAAYSLDDIHMDPAVYPQPHDYNPGRYSDKSNTLHEETHSYLGWGSGYHPCLGERVAKLELTMLMAYLIVYFDFEVSDEHGERAQQLPAFPDRNRYKPQREDPPMFVRYRLRTADL